MPKSNRPSSNPGRLSEIQSLLAGELQRRVAEMPLGELLRLTAAALEDAPLPAAPPSHVTGLPSSAPDRMRLTDALHRVMATADRPLTSEDIIARVLALRPGTPDASIRSDISRGYRSGFLKLHGDVRNGGTYTLGRSSVRVRKAG